MKLMCKSSSRAFGIITTTIIANIYLAFGFPDGSNCKESVCSAADLGLISRLGRSPGEGNGNPFQYSCLENSVDGLQFMGLQRVGHD